MSDVVKDLTPEDGEEESNSMETFKAEAKKVVDWVEKKLDGDSAEKLGTKLAGVLVNGVFRFGKGLWIGTFYGPNPEPKKPKTNKKS